MRYIAIVLILIVAHTVLAFELKEAPELGPTSLVRWAPSSLPVPFVVDSKGSADLPIAAVVNAVQQSFLSWQVITGQSMRFQFAGTKAGASVNCSDSINSVLWLESNWPNSKFILAITKNTFLLESPPTFIDADIIVNGQDYIWSDKENVPGKVDIQEVLQHEAGHFLGLQHTQVRKAKMLFNIQKTRVLSADDKAAIRFLYPESSALLFKQLNPVPRSVLLGNSNPDSTTFPPVTFRWTTPGGSTNFVLQFSSKQIGRASCRERV